MNKKSLLEKAKRLTKLIYLKLFRINDDPLKIALGFGLGAFVGVMPGIGPAIALLFAFIFRVNRASALLASIMFNTWIGLIAILLAIKIGSVVTGLSYNDIYLGWNGLIKNFKWEKLFEVSVYKVLVPIGIGYLIIALSIAIITSVIVYLIAKQIKIKKEKRKMISAKNNKEWSLSD